MMIIGNNRIGVSQKG